MRQALAVIALAALLVTAGCSGAGSGVPETPDDGSTPTATSNSPGTNGASGSTHREAASIRVSGQSSVRASPDRAVLRIGVRASAKDVSTARRRLAENASRMRAALEEMGIDESQVTTTDFDIDQRYVRPRARGEGPRRRFVARHDFVITLADLNRTGAVIVTAVESGATSIDDVRFVLSQRTRRNLRERALERAMEDARSQAETLAAQEGLRVSGVEAIRTADVGFVDRESRGVAVTATPAATPAPTEIDTGTVTVTARVNVAYNATER